MDGLTVACFLVIIVNIHTVEPELSIFVCWRVSINVLE